MFGKDLQVGNRCVRFATIINEDPAYVLEVTAVDGGTVTVKNLFTQQVEKVGFSERVTILRM